MAKSKCQGIFGIVFGHKFWNLNYYTNYCERCGMPKGGWQ